VESPAEVRVVPKALAVEERKIFDIVAINVMRLFDNSLAAERNQVIIEIRDLNGRPVVKVAVGLRIVLCERARDEPMKRVRFGGCPSSGS
jgi:hypothetical protein